MADGSGNKSNNAFGRFFNDSDLDQIEGFINGVLSTPDIPKDNENEQLSSDFLNNAFESDDKKELDQILNQFGIPADRLLRYSAYDEIYRSVSMIKRIVKVYKSNIIQKNPVSGLWYLLRKTDYTKSKNIENEQNSGLAKTYYEGVTESFKLLFYLKNLYIHNQLMYGNCFIEVVDLKKEIKDVDLTKLSTLNEINDLNRDVFKYNKNTPELMIEEAINTLAESLYTISDVAGVESGEIEAKSDEAKSDEAKTKDKTEDLNEDPNDELRFKDVLIRAHKPQNVIILETKYGTKLGYLEVSRDLTSSSNNLTQTLSSITNKIVNVTNEQQQGNLLTSREAILNKIISHILKKVTSKNKVKFDPSVIEGLKRFVVEQNLQNNQPNLKPVEVRFIPLNRMVDFSFPSSEHYPYGGSVIEPLLLPGKLFILSQLSNIYMKLSRAPLNRKWIRVELVPLRSNSYRKIW